MCCHAVISRASGSHHRSPAARLGFQPRRSSAAVIRRVSAVPTSLLRSHYGLTARQLQLVIHLADGASLDEAAAAMAIGMPTARSHLAKCFEKTGTHRQSELIGLALSLVPPVLE